MERLIESIQQGGSQLAGRRGPESDRPGYAGIQRHAFMGDVRWKIEHVSGFQYPFLFGPEVR